MSELRPAVAFPLPELVSSVGPATGSIVQGEPAGSDCYQGPNLVDDSDIADWRGWPVEFEACRKLPSVPPPRLDGGSSTSPASRSAARPFTVPPGAAVVTVQCRKLQRLNCRIACRRPPACWPTDRW